MSQRNSQLASPAAKPRRLAQGAARGAEDVAQRAVPPGRRPARWRGPRAVTWEAREIANLRNIIREIIQISKKNIMKDILFVRNVNDQGCVDVSSLLSTPDNSESPALP